MLTRDAAEQLTSDDFWTFAERLATGRRLVITSDHGYAATGCVINLSIGDPARPFIHTPSPWARLLDWLSWKYRVLFCVSAGNYMDAIDIGLSGPDYLALTDEEKVEHVL